MICKDFTWPSYGRYVRWPEGTFPNYVKEMSIFLATPCTAKHLPMPLFYRTSIKSHVRIYIGGYRYVFSVN